MRPNNALPLHEKNWAWLGEEFRFIASKVPLLLRQLTSYMQVKPSWPDCCITFVINTIPLKSPQHQNTAPKRFNATTKMYATHTQENIILKPNTAWSIRSEILLAAENKMHTVHLTCMFVCLCVNLVVFFFCLVGPVISVEWLKQIIQGFIKCRCQTVTDTTWWKE